MISFERYLIEKGFDRFYYDLKTKELIFEKDKYILSSISNLDYRYIKGNEVFIIGLSEKGAPPNLIYPRPWVNIGGFIVNDYCNVIMDRVFVKYGNEGVISAIRENKHLKLE